MTTDLDLADGIAYMREHCEKIGRETPPDVFLASVTKPGEEWNAQAINRQARPLQRDGCDRCSSEYRPAKPARNGADNAEPFRRRSYPEINLTPQFRLIRSLPP